MEGKSLEQIASLSLVSILAALFGMPHYFRLDSHLELARKEGALLVERAEKLGPRPLFPELELRLPFPSDARTSQLIRETSLAWIAVDQSQERISSLIASKKMFNKTINWAVFGALALFCIILYWTRPNAS
jgi:hypothetical protein